jgi:hypothetical protein
MAAAMGFLIAELRCMVRELKHIECACDCLQRPRASNNTAFAMRTELERV